MIIKNNMSSMMALHQVNENISQLNKNLRSLSSGMKINSAGDGASEYSISEKMRVRIRALAQDSANVKNGNSLLQVAAGAIQQQINLLREVKAKVIDAHNDTNTDSDRATIQKEIDHCYDQIDSIAFETTFNGKNILVGNTVVDIVESWAIKDKAELVEDSDSLKFIPDVYDNLDGQEGSFDIFDKYKNETPETNKMSGGADAVYDTNGTSNVIEVDFSSYSSVDELDNVGITLKGTNSLTTKFVLTKDTARDYSNSPTEIDISDCMTIEDVAVKVAAATNNKRGLAAVADGTKVTYTANTTGTATNSCNVTGFSAEHKEATPGGVVQRAYAPRTEIAIGNFSGGTDHSGVDDDDPDTPEYKPATPATLVMDVNPAPTGSGITIQSQHSNYYVEFVDGTSEPTYNLATQHYKVGKDYNGVYTRFSNIKFSMAGGKLTLETTMTGTQANNTSNYQVTDGISETKTAPTPEYTAVKALTATTIDNKKCGADNQLISPAKTASYTMDLSGYADKTDAGALEDLIGEWTGKTINYRGVNYEFIDRKDLKSINSVQKVYGSALLDLNSLRSQINGTRSVADIFAGLLNSRLGTAKVVTDGKTTGATFTASSSGAGGNSQSVKISQGKLNSYKVEFGKWFEDNPSDNVPAMLNNKGFRAYCATCADQWFNFAFTDGNIDDDKPTSGTDLQDIKTILINVSEVTDADSLMQAIYDQAMPVLTGSDKNYNHQMRLAIDKEKGNLIVYDKRAFPLSKNSTYPDYQSKGAKIADGILDNVIKEKRKVYANRLVIQHTDKASMNILVDVPQTSIDHIFGYIRGNYEPSYYNVMTSEMREKLLGTRDPVTGIETKGILDKGIDYLTDAATLVGSQINHMEYADANITVEQENAMASESVIRDADMAKTMMEYTKYNVLSQAAQAMLAQANQEPSMVLSLLQ